MLQDLGGDKVTVKNAGGLPQLGGQAYFGEGGSEYGGWRVGMAPSGILPGNVRAMARQGLHSAEIGHNCGAHFLAAHL